MYQNSSFDRLHSQQRSFWKAIIKLVGHVLGGAILFMSIAFVAWSIGIGVDKLNTIHAFNDSILLVLHLVEKGLLYLDVLLSGIVVLVGASRFLKEI